MSGILPGTIEPWFAAIIVATSFLTSSISAALGLGGGVLLIAIMGFGLPLTALIPVHGVVQLGSNAGRALLQWRHATRWILLWFGAGSMIGTLVAGRLTLDLPETVWRLGLGVFILMISWLPKPNFGRTARPIVLLNGILGAIFTMFFGATGPLVMAINAPHAGSRHGIVATHAVAMTLQHSLKIMMFGFLGFAFAPWLPLIVMMVLSGHLGTILGTRLLNRLPEERFRAALKGLLTVLALGLIIQGLAATG
uniref:sulfite exporter TauE/SafE family protein n=1 Tax=Pararhizobium sp. IMCC3301 TaxID=3067904 RepID=UPI0027406038|nr:sulfite exporter TauE/SafE family protein [Pararhizobium sp. IMCC3301]